MAIPQSFIDELVARCDIVDVVSKYVKLTKKGNSYFGLCPFHNEKTASFSVAPEKQIYHCFGCSAGGGVISFIMHVEGLIYIDAIAFLADSVGMKVPENDTDNKTRDKRERLLAILKATARHYYGNLQKEKNANARNYFLKRKLRKKTMDNFGLGFSEDSWDDLINHLKAKGFYLEEIFEAGLAAQGKNGGYYDRFRGRVMFPIIDVRGNVIGFGARVLDDSLPKYINSPEGLVYSKSRNLFAMNLARKSKHDSLILVEGYMDVIALHQAGFDNAVASLGTALTEEQAKLLSRYKSKIIVCYDSDDAGQRATARAIDILAKTEMEVRVLKIPSAKDPDSYIAEFGADAFENLLHGGQNHIEYKLLTVKAKFNIEVPDEKVEFLKECAKIISRLDSAVSREVYSNRVASMAEITPEAMKIEVTRAFKNIQNAKKANEKRKILSPVNMAQPDNKALRYTNIKSARAEEGIISLVFADNLLMQEILGKIQKDEFSSEFLAKIYEHALRLYQNKEMIGISSFEGILEPFEMSALASILSRPAPTLQREKALEDYIATIKFENINKIDSLERISQMNREKKGYGGAK